MLNTCSGYGGAFQVSVCWGNHPLHCHLPLIAFSISQIKFACRLTICSHHFNYSESRFPSHTWRVFPVSSWRFWFDGSMCFLPIAPSAYFHHGAYHTALQMFTCLMLWELPKGGDCVPIFLHIPSAQSWFLSWSEMNSSITLRSVFYFIF